LLLRLAPAQSLRNHLKVGVILLHPEAIMVSLTCSALWSEDRQSRSFQFTQPEV
jgi:hypothetical protein